jgi:sugar phosphate isomerase/epimerase
MYSLSSCWNSGRHQDGRDMLREIADLGFQYAELSHGIRVSLIPGIIAAVEAGDIRISTLHNFCPLPMGVNHPAPNLFKFTATEKRERDLAWKHSLKTIETAQRVGAKLVVLHSGEVNLAGFFGKPEYQDKLEELAAANQVGTPRYQKIVEDLEKRRESRKEQPMALSLDFIRRLADVAVEAGILLGIENREAVEEIPFDHDLPFFLDQLPENVRYWHDCGHAEIKQQLGFIDHRLHFETMSSRLGGLHIHDVILTPTGPHDHAPPGSGIINYEALKPFIRPDHIKVIELNPGVTPEDVKRGYEHIRSVWGPE